MKLNADKAMFIRVLCESGSELFEDELVRRDAVRVSCIFVKKKFLIYFLPSVVRRNKGCNAFKYFINLSLIIFKNS